MAKSKLISNRSLAKAYEPGSLYKVVIEGAGGPTGMRGYPFKQRALDYQSASKGVLIEVSPTLEVEVVSVRTGKLIERQVGVSPAEAVLAVYATHTMNDHDETRYFERYSRQVKFSPASVICGDYAALR
jgi:hypothetical protein